MRELPDVEVFCSYLGSTALHKRIADAEVSPPARMRNRPLHTLGHHLTPHRLEATDRHGNFVFVALKKRDWLVFHSGVAGFLRYFEEGDAPAHTLLLLHAANGYRLAYAPPRKLGHVDPTNDPGDYVDVHDLGIDSLSVSESQFRHLQRGRGRMKSWLMNQRMISSLGNKYSDKFLFQAKLDPRSWHEDLTNRHWQTLYRRMRAVKETAIGAPVDPARMHRAFPLPHRREREQRPRCQRRIGERRQRH